MRRYTIVLLLAADMLLLADSASKPIVHSFTSVADSHNIYSIQRFLRTESTTVGAGDERAGLGNAFNALTASATRIVKLDKLQKYLLIKKTPVDVSNKLKFGDDVADALKSSKVGALSDYIAMLNKNTPDNTVTLIGTLSARYGDDAVAKALVSAQTREDSTLPLKELATQLRSQQINAWLDNEMSVDDVFKVLKLRDNGYEALTSRKLEVLEDYIAKFNRNNPGQETSMVKTLVKGFGGDTNLVKILASAQHDARTMKQADQLERALIRLWRHENLEPTSVMKLLELDRDVNSALKSSNLKLFQKYLVENNRKDPDNQVTLLSVLTSKYGEPNVAKALVSALRSGNAETDLIAARLQNELLGGWLKRDMSVVDVFKLLKFEIDGSVVVSRNLKTLKEYIRLYNRAKKIDETLVGALAKGFGGEETLAAMLARARPFPHLKEKAQKLQNAQFREWMDKDLNSLNILTKIFKVAGADSSTVQKQLQEVTQLFWRERTRR